MSPRHTYPKPTVHAAAFYFAIAIKRFFVSEAQTINRNLLGLLNSQVEPQLVDFFP